MLPSINSSICKALLADSAILSVMLTSPMVWVEMRIGPAAAMNVALSPQAVGAGFGNPGQDDRRRAARWTSRLRRLARARRPAHDADIGGAGNDFTSG